MLRTASVLKRIEVRRAPQNAIRIVISVILTKKEPFFTKATKFFTLPVAAVMVDNLRRLLLGINLSDKAIMDFDFPGVGFPV